MSTAREIVRSGRCSQSAPARSRASEAQRPLLRLSDIWKAPLHDFPIRDEILYQFLPLPLTRDMDVLEIGPGSGFTAFRLSPRVRSLTLVDVAVNTVAELRSQLGQLANIHCVHADVTRTQSVQELGASFDLAFGLDVFEYVVDPEACLRNLAGVLRPGGHLLLSYPNVPPPAGDGVTYFNNLSELEALLGRSDFCDWQVLAVKLRSFASAIYHALHEWPLQLYRATRKGRSAALPQTYDATWAFQNRRQLLRYKVPLHLMWAILARIMHLGGELFTAETATGAILGKQLVIMARR